MPVSYVKDPDADLDYTVDWSGWLPAGDTIASTTWTVDDDALTGHDTAHTDTTSTVWLSGGTTGATYAATCRITTTAGRINDSTIFVTVADS